MALIFLCCIHMNKHNYGQCVSLEICFSGNLMGKLLNVLVKRYNVFVTVQKVFNTVQQNPAM